MTEPRSSTRDTGRSPSRWRSTAAPVRRSRSSTQGGRRSGRRLTPMASTSRASTSSPARRRQALTALSLDSRSVERSQLDDVVTLVVICVWCDRRLWRRALPWRSPTRAASTGCWCLRASSTRGFAASTARASCLSPPPADRCSHREHDLAELLAGLEPRVRRTDLRERQHLVHHRARAPARDEVVGALEVGLRAHRRAEDRQLLPPDAVQRRGRVRARSSRRRRRSAPRARRRRATCATSPRRRARRRRRRRAAGRLLDRAPSRRRSRG